MQRNQDLLQLPLPVFISAKNFFRILSESRYRHHYISHYMSEQVLSCRLKPKKFRNIKCMKNLLKYLQSDIEKLISKLNEPVIAVGTTSLRTLETLYWLGLMISQNKNISPSELYSGSMDTLSSNSRYYPAESLFICCWNGSGKNPGKN